MYFQLVFSKILSMCWPHYGGCAERCAQAQDASTNKNVSDAELRQSFQTTGQVKTTGRQSRPAMGASMKKNNPAPMQQQ
jgi:hypothetical protein